MCIYIICVYIIIYMCVYLFDYEKSTLKPPSVMDTCFIFNYNYFDDFYYYTNVQDDGRRYHVVGQACATVQLIFNGIHTMLGAVFLTLLQKKCRYGMYVCMHVSFLRLGTWVPSTVSETSLTVQKSGLGENCMNFHRVQPDLARIDVPSLQMQVVWLRVRTM